MPKMPSKDALRRQYQIQVAEERVKRESWEHYARASGWLPRSQVGYGTYWRVPESEISSPGCEWAPEFVTVKDESTFDDQMWYLAQQKPFKPI